MGIARIVEVLDRSTKGVIISQTTGAVAIATTIAPGFKWALKEIRVHLSAAGGAGDLTATIDSGTAAAYDIVILTQDMTSVVDLISQLDTPMIFGEDDELDIAWANANSRTYGLEVIYTRL